MESTVRLLSGLRSWVRGLEGLPTPSGTPATTTFPIMMILAVLEDGLILVSNSTRSV